MKKKFKINLNPVDNKIEKDIKYYLKLEPPDSYASIKDNKLNNICKYINKKYEFNNDNLLKNIILSIRSTQMKNHMMIRHKYLLDNKTNIINDYNNNMDILDLVKHYDGSPLNILRIIFQTKYNKKISYIMKNPQYIDLYDKKQIQKAIEYDEYAPINQNKILQQSLDFENKIKNILIHNNINFKTQEDLTTEQKLTNNMAINTPDFLILSDFYINKTKINWIDAKNFYGSYSRFMINKIISQTDKYINEWGNGAIIFSLSYNANLHFNNILLIDYDSFITACS